MAVTPADVATTLGRPAPAADSIEFAQWSMWIEDVRRVIGRRLGNLDNLDQGDLDYVVREAVARRSRRPDAATSTTVSVDDGSVTKRYESSSSEAAILPEWWDLLSPDSDSPAFSTRPGFVPDVCWPEPWWGFSC